MTWMRKIFIACALFILPAVPINAFPISLPNTARGDERLNSLPFDSANDLIVIDATLNGKGPFRFLLDTGASHHVMTPELAQSLGLQVEGGGVLDAGGQATMSVGLSQVEEVRVGNFTLRKQRFAIAPFPASYPFQGFIGAELFKRFIVRIDFRQSLLTLTLPNSSPYRGSGVALPIKFHQGLIPQVRAQVDGVGGWFKLDTGYNGSLALFGKFIAEHNLMRKYAPRKSDSGARTLTGELGGVPVTQIRGFTLGDLTLDGIHTAFFLEREGSNSAFAGAIGTGVLKQFNVTIDYERRRLILESS